MIPTGRLHSKRGSVLATHQHSSDVFSHSADLDSATVEDGPHKIDQHNSSKRLYPGKQYVPENKRSWATVWSSYSPVKYTSQEVLNSNGADPEDISRLDFASLFGQPNPKRPSHYPTQFSASLHPMNPFGRTGVEGRGVLYKWGPNVSADPIVTRWARSNADATQLALQVVLVFRLLERKWALPGGFLMGDMVTDFAACEETFKRKVLPRTAPHEATSQTFFLRQTRLRAC